MSDLRDLYQQVIVDHSKRPQNFGPLDSANHHAEGHNPLCGDRVKLHVATIGNQIQDIRFEGSGCAISTASASLMTQAVKGKSVSEAQDLFRLFRDLVTTDKAGEIDRLGKLAVFSGVREFPMRVKCATLAWHTLQNALSGSDNKVATTE